MTRPERKSKLREEIQQAKPFPSLEAEAVLNIQRTADALDTAFAAMLAAEASVTPAQYNVLRILRGAGADGLACKAIAARAVTRVPDITRLLDRLEPRGLITRERSAPDRRIVRARITESGLALLAGLDGPVEDFNRNRLGHLGTRKLRTLIRLLEEAREGA